MAEDQANMSATLELVVLQKSGGLESFRRLGASRWGDVYVGGFTAGAFRPRTAEDDAVQEELRPQLMPMFERMFAEALEIRP